MVLARAEEMGHHVPQRFKKPLHIAFERHVGRVEISAGRSLTCVNSFQSFESVWKAADQQNKSCGLGIWLGAALFPLF
jgi:hypothetical protein